MHKKFGLIKILTLVILFSSQLYSLEKMKKTTLQLSWFSQFQFAGYYIAKEKGFYKKEGIELTIKPYEFNINVQEEVSKEKSDFGIGRETLLLGKIKNFNNLVALYPLFQVSPIVFISKKDSNISKIKDFKNKRVMASLNDTNQIALKSMIYSNGVNFEDMYFLKHSHDINDLVLDKTDIISAYISKAPYLLKKQNIQYNIFSPKNYGFGIYSDFLFTNEELIDKDPSLVKSFKKASLKGWKYAYENIEESVDLILKKYNSQNLSKEELLFEAKELKKLSYVKDIPLGDIKKNNIIRMLDLYSLVGNIKEVDIEKFHAFIFQEKHVQLTQKERTFLKRKKLLTLCIQENNIPYEIINNDSVKGITPKYKKLLEEKMNIKIRTFIIQNQQVNDYLTKGYCDLFSTSNIKKNKSIDFSIPYIQLPYIVFSTKGNVFISNLSQLENTNIITYHSKDLNHLINKKYPLIKNNEVTTFKAGLDKIKMNKADFFITNIANASYFIKDFYAPDVYISGKLNEKQDFSFAVSKENKTLLNIINKTIKDIDEVEHDKIKSEFTNFQYKHIIDYSFSIKVTIFFSIIIILLIYFYQSEKKLKTKISKLNNSLKYKIEQEVKKSRQKDEYLFRQSKLASMGEMIRNIAHQWRQPLNRISLSSQVVETLIKESDPNNNDLIKKKLSHINENIQYMSDTIEDFMYYFNPNKEKKDFYFYEAFHKTLELIKTRTQDININLKINPLFKVNGYENEFKQIILVIFNNALDNYKIKQVMNFTIDVIIEEDSNNFFILIKDNGGGIDNSIINKIFEPYFTTKFKKEGSGIGLYMAKMIIEQSMHGTIDVNSSNNITNFLIKLRKE